MASPIEYLKGVGPLRGDMLRKDLSIFTFRDLLEYYPIRHIDKTKVALISSISEATDWVQVNGRLVFFEITGEKRARRLVAHIKDSSGTIELTWFQGISWVEKMLKHGEFYLVYGKPSFFNSKPQISHPEIELVSDAKADGKAFLEPVYSTTEKLKVRGLNGRQIGKFTYTLIFQLSERDVPEILSAYIVEKMKLIPRLQAFQQIHFPKSFQHHTQALHRLKFEELFIAQIRLNIIRINRNRTSRGIVFEKVGNLFNSFYSNHLPFELTGAQKRVLREIRTDTAQGHQMNRLLQGDVGSGKTIVALLSMLLAADNGYQSCLMAPTEILAKQHFDGLQNLLQDMPVKIGLLTGSTKTKQRRELLQALADGSLNMIIGTHAIIEDPVIFQNFGLAVIDEQHRFGVAQRAKLWNKASIHPHVLVMTATPIPRTLAMTAYGDLDYSVIDELPPGRKPVTTVHRSEMHRANIMGFIRSEVDKGRQAYIIYPLIEESEKLSYEDLMQGYEQVKSFFPEPKFYISMLHGRQPQDQKEMNMQRFVNGDTNIMVSTTVIEVGVNVPNATVMVIESAEKFGLSQLHQLRGRVGRGSDQSFCILLTGSKTGTDAKQRIDIMCSTNDGFKIAEKDLELRGPGEIDGKRQSGALNFKLASLVDDKELVAAARSLAEQMIEDDPQLLKEEHRPLQQYLQVQQGKTAWSKIS